MLTGIWASKSPKLLHMISLQEESLAYCWLYPFPHYPLCTTSGIKTTLEKKVWALFTEAWSPHVVLSLTFWLNSHLERGGMSSLLILPGLLRSDGETLVYPLLRENGRMPAAYVGDSNSLSWNFIGFPHKPSYSASFLHWIFSLSYPYLTTLYTFN